MLPELQHPPLRAAAVTIRRGRVTTVIRLGYCQDNRKGNLMTEDISECYITARTASVV